MFLVAVLGVVLIAMFNLYVGTERKISLKLNVWKITNYSKNKWPTKLPKRRVRKKLCGSKNLDKLMLDMKIRVAYTVYI